MKARTAILIALAVCLLLGSVALRQGFGRLSLTAQGSALAQSNGPPLPAQYVAAHGTASGGAYRLTSQALRQAQGDTWHVSGASSGGGYRLAGPAGTGNQCCCTFLPCLLRSYH